MKQQILKSLGVILVAGFSSTAFAQSTAQEGLERLKTNVDNSKSNLQSYQDNMKIVDGNLTEIGKARVQVETQRNDVAAQLKINGNSMSKVEKQEADINKLIQQEDKETQNEETKVKELEKVIAQLKDNQTKRQQNIVKYKLQIEQVTKEKGEWKGHQDALLKQKKEIDDRLALVKKTEKDWANKKRGYEGEIGRWQKETDKNQKMLEQYTAMANQKE